MGAWPYRHGVGQLAGAAAAQADEPELSTFVGITDFPNAPGPLAA